MCVFYLSGAVTGLIKGNVLLLLAVHAQACLNGIPLSIRFKLHLSHVVKQLRQMLLDLLQTWHGRDTFSLNSIYRQSTI